MAPNPPHAEATGQLLTAVTFGGGEYKLPAQSDDWPLDLIELVRGIRDKKLVVNRPALLAAMSALLGAQWPALAESTKTRDLIAASNVFATAVGFPVSNLLQDLAFGSLPRILTWLRLWPGPIEADLRRGGIRYSDRWRFDPDGQRRLTLREVGVQIEHRRWDSALSEALFGERPLSDSAQVLMDLFELQTRQRHPGRPMSPAEKAQREEVKAVEDAERARYRARREKRGLAAARANAQLAQGSEGT